MELFSRSSRRLRCVVCVTAVFLILLVMFMGGGLRSLIHLRMSSPSPTSDLSFACPIESRWVETLSFPDGHVRLIQRIFKSITAAVPAEPPTDTDGVGGGDIVSRALAADVTAECSRWRTVDNYSVCQVGPLRPKPGSCLLLAQATALASSLTAAFGCRSLTLPLVGEHPTPPVDILLADWGAQASSGLPAALREGWLENVRQLVLGVDVSPGATSWTQLRALLSIVDSLDSLGFRQWRAPVTLGGDSASSGRHRRILLHFINQNVLYAKLPPTMSPSSSPESLSTHAEVYLLRSFSKSNLEREIEASLTANVQSKMEVTYFRQIRNNHAMCSDSQRIGDEADGGWDVCFSRPFSILADTGKSSGCTAFSFGINNVFGYDNALAMEFNCTVRMFDPSMTNMSDQRMGSRRQWFYQTGLAGRSGSVRGWKMRTLCSLIDEFTGSPNSVIDVLKIDIELWEWPSLETALAEGCLARVKQLLFESHTVLSGGAAPDYAAFLRVWLRLVRAGFRMWKWHENPQSFWYPSLGDSETRLPCCYEHYLLNWNFVH